MPAGIIDLAFYLALLPMVGGIGSIALTVVALAFSVPWSFRWASEAEPDPATPLPAKLGQTPEAAPSRGPPAPGEAQARETEPA